MNVEKKITYMIKKEHTETERAKVRDFINKLKAEGKEVTFTEGVAYFVVKYSEKGLNLL